MIPTILHMQCSYPSIPSKVRQADMELFKATFEKHGLPPRGVIFPTYGLAEHTVFVCTNGKRMARDDQKALLPTSNGIQEG
jgi:acyl-CoA synthetase (AMP-forming)/AMP-acid ligase II